MSNECPFTAAFSVFVIQKMVCYDGKVDRQWESIANHSRVMKEWKNQEHHLSAKIINPSKHRYSPNKLCCMMGCLSVTSLTGWCDSQTKVQCVTDIGRLWGRYFNQFKAQLCYEEHSINPWVKINQFVVCGHIQNLGRHLVWEGSVYLCATASLCAHAYSCPPVYWCVCMGVQLCV